MSNKLSVKDLDLKKQRVLMRVDFNVPLDKQGNITSDTRIEASLPTIRYIIDQGASLVLMSHLGRPKGKRSKDYSLAPCAKRLSEMLGVPVQMAPDCVGAETLKMATRLRPGEVLLLENLRFHEGEEKPDAEPSFVHQLAKMGTVYVNDAFGTAHRAHASTALIADLFTGKAAAGLLMQKEIQFLGNKLLHPKLPFCALIGGAKVSTKVGVIRSLIQKADTLLIGGGMAYTFLKAEGIPIGSSICEDNLLLTAREILRDSKQDGVQIVLPIDHIITDKIGDSSSTVKLVEGSKGIPDGFQGVDIGPKTIELFKKHLKHAATILWNGPLGIFEEPKFAEGTNSVAKAIAETRAVTIVGGGDSIAAVQSAGVASDISHISTGGGASLEYIEHGKLPGIEALTDAESSCLQIGI